MTYYKSNFNSSDNKTKVKNWNYEIKGLCNALTGIRD